MIPRRLGRFLLMICQKCRILTYRFLSDARNVESRARHVQPVLVTGQGKLRFGRCNLGVWPSPHFLSGYIHIEARHPEAEILIGNDVWINNNASIIAERCRVEIGDRTLIGPEFMLVDSDFHHLDPAQRLHGQPKCSPVTIGKNVFIGARVTVLKGVSIGDNSVVSAGSLVLKDIPPDVVAGGVPAKVIRKIQDALVGEKSNTEAKNVDGEQGHGR